MQTNVLEIIDKILDRLAGESPEIRFMRCPIRHCNVIRLSTVYQGQLYNYQHELPCPYNMDNAHLDMIVDRAIETFKREINHE